MAYDHELAGRMRDALTGTGDITERRMMGGLCFFLNGNMVCGADRSKAGERRLMFRVGKGNDRAVDLPGAVMVRLGGRPMPGFFFVDADHCDDALLSRWLDLALTHARGLPPK